MTGWTEVVSLLLAAGANIDLQNLVILCYCKFSAHWDLCIIIIIILTTIKVQRHRLVNSATSS